VHNLEQVVVLAVALEVGSAPGKAGGDQPSVRSSLLPEKFVKPWTSLLLAKIEQKRSVSSGKGLSL